ncbi:DUF2878 domain-containing protein [Vibrio sp. F74]|uniref:DUF2878 domain-containing protein n=1 Tax=Vibrio sp. F74 TaxID=700020 RepID=UPI0035F5C3F9
MKLFWIINLFLFQASWLCAAFFTEYANQIMPLLLIIHFALSPTRIKDLRLLMLVPIGLIADKFQLELGVFSAGDSFFPIWLLMLWIMFIISLNHSLRWLDNRSIPTLMLIGAIGGASSYWGGIKAGVLVPLLPTSSVVFSLILVWTLLLPVFVILKRYVNQPANAHVLR